MDSVKCDQCGSTVASDEQFCPSCGAFIDPLAPEKAPKPAPGRGAARPSGRPGNVISISSDGNKYEEFSLEQAPEPPTPKPPRVTNGNSTTCPSCGAANPANNRHCQQCGARLDQGPLPKASRPAVQATAGVRAAFYIAALLFGVIVVALAFNFFGSPDAVPSTTTTAATTSSSGVPASAEIGVIRHTCTPQGIGSFVCENLSNGVGTEFQVNWEDLEANEQTLTIRLDFDRAMTITRIEWMNLGEGDRFYQNHRARGLSIQGDQAITPIPIQLLDTSSPQVIEFTAVGAFFVTIEVLSTFPAQLTNGNIFRELAIDEIVVWGRPTD